MLKKAASATTSRSARFHPARHAAFLALLVFNLLTGILKPTDEFCGRLGHLDQPDLGNTIPI